MDEKEYDKFRSRKWKALVWGIIIPTYLVIAGAFIYAFVHQADLGFNFAKIFCGVTLVGILGYCGVNVWQKKIENGVKK